MKKIKVIMINPFDESVSEVEIDNGLESICKTMQCRVIDIIYLCMNGLIQLYPNTIDRYKFIVEECIYFSDINYQPFL